MHVHIHTSRNHGMAPAIAQASMQFQGPLMLQLLCSQDVLRSEIDLTPALAVYMHLSTGI